MIFAPRDRNGIARRAHSSIDITRKSDIAQTALDISNELCKREHKFVPRSSLKFSESFTKSCYGLTYVYFVAIVFVQTLRTDLILVLACASNAVEHGMVIRMHIPSRRHGTFNSPLPENFSEDSEKSTIS